MQEIRNFNKEPAIENIYFVEKEEILELHKFCSAQGLKITCVYFVEREENV